MASTIALPSPAGRYPSLIYESHPSLGEYVFGQIVDSAAAGCYPARPARIIMSDRPRDASAPDPHRAAVLVHVPESLDDAQRLAKYDEPLAFAVRDAGVGDFVGGVSKTGSDGQAESVVLELTLHDYHSISVVIDALFKIGAPGETVVEAETEKATLSLSLAEAAGG